LINDEDSINKSIRNYYSSHLVVFPQDVSARK